MSVSIRVLQVEDSESDASLVLRQLQRGGLTVDARRVESAAEMQDALTRQRWDVVIADYWLPQFNALHALRVLQGSGLDIPFIVVSGTIGEEIAVGVMKAGANDYLMKDRLDRLAPVVERELRDATARHDRLEARHALDDLKAEYQVAIETSSDGYWVIDREGRFLQVNDALVRRSGYSRKALLTMRVSDLEVRESYAEIAQRIARITKTGRERFETTFRSASGETWDIDLSASYLPAGGGRLFVFGRDVTDQRRAAEELRRFVAASPAVLYAARMLPGHRAITWVSENFTSLTGYSLAAATLEMWRAALHPDDRERVLAAHPVPYTADHQVLEYQFRHAAGHFIWIRDEKRLTAGRLGRDTELVGSWTDVTARVLLEQQYRQAQKMEAIGRLAGGVAHDFNNLLTVIQGYGHLLMVDDGLPEHLRADVEQIGLAAQRASGLTQQLLTFSRKQVVEFKHASLNDIVAGVDKLLHRLIGEDIIVTTTLAPGLPAVRVDPMQMEQVLVNLAVNARDAMPLGGTLTISTNEVDLHEGVADGRAAGRYVRLTVGDTGCGMTAETMARVFEPFFTTKKPGEGTGLGLATVFGIVRQADGFIDVSSAPGMGAQFTIDLPTASEAVANADASHDDRSDPSGHETILLVEDEDSVRKITQLALATRGYQVLVASTGEEALALAATHHVDLVLTDVVMPGMSGYVLGQRLGETLGRSRILYMSGYIGDALVRNGLQADAATFLHKPFTPRELAQKVRDRLDAAASESSSPDAHG